MSLPGYLQPLPEAARRYGTLSYNRKVGCWTIKAEPCAVELAKRLFPGCEGNRGEARFTAHRRAIGDLNWLMLRYPLDIASRDVARWENALSEARDWALRREEAALLPEMATPPDAYFSGTLMPFQRRGLAYLLGNERALLADEMGLGKTVQAIALLASTRRFPALLVVPPHLVRNWQRELERFLILDGEGARAYVIKGLTPYDLPEADVYIIHYLLLRGWKERLPALGFQTLLFDEIQELRRAGTEKYSAASLLSDACERVIGLSGTPIYNRGGEIWNVINILDFHFLGSWESFSRAWCDGYGGGVVMKPDLLGAYLREEGLMLRRTKEEVLPELPPKRRLVQEIDADDALYERLTREVLQKLRVLRDDEALTPSKRALLEEQVSQQERQATGLAKADYVAAFVAALLEGGEKVLLFAHHHAVMDAYQKQLKAFHPVFITGRESDQQKDSALRAFMAGETNLCCVSLRSASGLNLQRATCVVFGELDWSPAVHSQAEDRAYRIGQADSLLCYYLVSPRGSDRDMQEALGLKVSQFLALMGDAPVPADQVAAQQSAARGHVLKLMARLENEEREHANAF
ncbi:MAG: DEAD/DEAH box helicase [Oscillospiraceae bacterium]|nr:DEAD/DEAH box helicase [Oscillospiraceae bacterium]